jgi:hypothetical protein
MVLASLRPLGGVLSVARCARNRSAGDRRRRDDAFGGDFGVPAAPVGSSAVTEPTSPEDAVRSYLTWLDDPSSAIDQSAVERADAEFASATDPLAKLHAAAARERARTADADALVSRFVAHAKAYADAADIPVEAFRALGVDDDVLARAGFDVPRRGRGSAAPARRSSGRPRAAQIGVGQLKAVAVQMPKRFTLAQLADKAGGGSPATVRKAVEELIAEGRAASLGPDTEHVGPGRAPTLYELR